MAQSKIVSNKRLLQTPNQVRTLNSRGPPLIRNNILHHVNGHHSRGDDFVWVCDPGEGFWIVIGLGDEAVNGCLEIDNGSEYPAFESALGEFGEETLDRVEPRAGGWREVEDEARVAGEP